jgi:hypothetical protein
MNNKEQNNMVKSEVLKKQLDDLESKNATNNPSKKGSTNEIQPFATGDEITQ